MEEWEVVTPSSRGEEMENGEKKEALEEEKATHQEPTSEGNQEAWDGKTWSKYLSPNQ